MEACMQLLAGNILEGRLVHTLEFVVGICTIVLTILAIIDWVCSNKRKK
jgi:hypothetical protein